MAMRRSALVSDSSLEVALSLMACADVLKASATALNASAEPLTSSAIAGDRRCGFEVDVQTKVNTTPAIKQHTGTTTD